MPRPWHPTHEACKASPACPRRAATAPQAAGTYDAGALDALYTGDDARTLIVLKALRDRVADPIRMRALGFCVSVAHAEYMARRFTEAGIPSRAVTGDTPAADRARASSDLRDHTVACLFTVVAEAQTLLRLGADASRHVPGIDGVALRSHCTYRRDEILAGIGWADGSRKTSGHAAGVAYAEATNVDALLVTLHKEEKDFAPSTRYRDYPLAADLFHWESQNATTAASGTGRRYLDGTSHVLLFVRQARTDAFGGGAPFLCLGRASLVEHRGQRPISITWRLARPMPVEILQAGAVDAA